MVFLKRCKSKRVIAIVLSVVIAFCSTLPTFAQTKQQLNNNQNKIEITNTQNKVIGIKGRDNMRNNIKGRKLHVKATAYANDSITATGTKPKPYYTLAADPKILPYGTKVYIPEFGKTFLVEDCGSAIKGDRIDIYMNNEKECIQWGIRNITIYVLE